MRCVFDAVFVARDHLDDYRKSAVQEAKISPQVHYYAFWINQNGLPGSRFLLGPIKDGVFGHLQLSLISHPCDAELSMQSLDLFNSGDWVKVDTSSRLASTWPHL
jgi:hypothetical protein